MSEKLYLWQGTVVTGPLSLEYIFGPHRVKGRRAYRVPCFDEHDVGMSKREFDQLSLVLCVKCKTVVKDTIGIK